jgi:hypothetical protein
VERLSESPLALLLERYSRQYRAELVALVLALSPLVHLVADSSNQNARVYDHVQLDHLFDQDFDYLVENPAALQMNRFVDLLHHRLFHVFDDFVQY